MSSHMMQQQVERSRAEVNMLKQHIQAAGASIDRTMMKRVTTAEQMLSKAEAAIRRVKQAGHSSTRTGPAPREGDRARRALAVLHAAPARHVATVPKVPLREEQLPALFKRASHATKLAVPSIRSDGCGFLCENVFRAFLWFRDVAPQDLPPGEKPSEGKRLLEPEWIAVFGIDEPSIGRWSTSKHAVFGVLTERANAAVRYFWAKEKTGAEAFVALAKWLALHRTMFSDTCDGRRLAFDASRGFFLPACVRSFDGVGGARFTRGSIPVRSASSYSRSGNPSVPVPTAVQQHAQQQAAAANPAVTAAGVPQPGVGNIQGNGTQTKMET